MPIISPYQFAIFRILFGTYLLGHFVYLMSYAGELFSRDGVSAEARFSAAHGYSASIFYFLNPSLLGARLFLGALAILSLFILAGYYRRTSASVVWCGWVSLINPNSLTGNLGILAVGLILLCLAFIPPGEPLSRSVPFLKERWRFPRSVYVVAWVVLAMVYTLDGLAKLKDPSWIDGSALLNSATSPGAFPEFLRYLFLAVPPSVTSLATYFLLIGELLFLPLSATSQTRFMAWLWLFAIQIGLLTVDTSSNSALGMVMLHLFLFDPAWLPARLKKKGNIVVFFDGVCGLCNRTVTLLLSEDRSQILRFSPLQGRAAHQFIGPESESIIVVDGYSSDDAQVLRASTAVFRAFDAIGGIWRVVALLRFVPQPVRDWVYYLIARNRYRWFGKSSECALIEPLLKERFLD